MFTWNIDRYVCSPSPSTPSYAKWTGSTHTKAADAFTETVVLLSLREYWLEYCNRASRKFFLIQCNLLFKKYLLENGLECFVLIESTPVGRCISPSAFPRTWKWFSVFFQLVRFLESTRSISSFNLSSARIALPERKGIVPFFLLKCHPHRSPSDPLRAYYVSSLVSHCRVYAHFSCPWLYR